MAIIGREDDVIPRLVSRYGGLADRVTPYPLGTTRDRQRLLALLAKELPR